jgi:hypothetical protein
VFNRIGVFAASPVASFLALLLELLLSLGVGEAKAQLDTVALTEHAVVFTNDTFGDLA